MKKEIIVQKLAQLEKYRQELDELVLRFSPAEVLQNSSKRLVAERLVQLIVDTMVDINLQFILTKDLTYDQTRSTFILMGELGVLPKGFANKIAPLVGLRNILVHRYEQLDKELFIKNLFQNADDFKQYVVYVNKSILAGTPRP